MGRKDTDEMSAAQILYPCMQCADIFFLKVSRPTDRMSAGSLRPATNAY